MEINQIVETGVSFGAVLAITISFTTNRSIFWAIIAGFFGWFYVVFAALDGKDRRS